VGRNKKQCVEEFGKEQVKIWRRSWDVPPPPMTKDFIFWPGNDPRYYKLGVKPDDIPLSESLKCVTKRTSVFWDEVIVPQLRQGKRLLIVGHENNLRSLIKRLDDISNDDILHVELPRAIPLVYELDPVSLKPIRGLPGCVAPLNGRYIGDAHYTFIMIILTLLYLFLTLTLMQETRLIWTRSPSETRPRCTTSGSRRT
jgi:2,3-bisphosphoglycerate-dependent phosphoglycerate mutase